MQIADVQSKKALLVDSAYEFSPTNFSATLRGSAGRFYRGETISK